jgi:asparagine synthase (glutamine-hydrolysing)
MCGIIAISGEKAGQIPEQKIESMLSCLRKRGPDDKGYVKFPDCIIGQTRLSIVDLSGGRQPMRDNTHPYTIVFNGEIYGYKELKQKLEKAGHRFSSSSDTEVILKAYAEYGEDCVKHLDGMFAFALWDENKKHLFIARDRFGKKPLYYTHVDGTFLAASEIKSIFATDLVKGKVDPEMLDAYLHLMYIPPHRTIYSNIQTLLPAHAAIVKDSSIRSWRYWDLEKHEQKISYEDAKQEIKRLFDIAVKTRMVADVEIGSFLSGGVDSTLTTYYAQKYSSFPIKTFSVGYDGHKNELEYALQASKKIGTDHYPLSVTADLVKELEGIIEYMDEPHGDSSNFPQHLVSKLAGSKVKVALTGDGADELFMGYGWYQKHWNTPRWRLDWAFLNPFTAQQKAITIYPKHERERLLKEYRAYGKSEFEKNITENLTDSIHKINAFDLKYYLPGQLLSKIDRTSMMHSLEVRSPFLDTALAEFVYNLPTEFKLSKTENKIILKDILSEIMPKEFVYRRKQGFGAPIDHWLKQENVRSFISELFNEDSEAYTYLNKREVQKVKDNYYAGVRNSALKLWLLVCLLLWFKKHSKYHTF